MEAALSEFAQHGFEGASIRGIGQRAGLEHTLLKHHFSNKDTLWQSTAAYAFEKIYSLWEEAIPVGSEMSAAERVSIEFHTLFRFTVSNPDFYQFMARESSIDSPRLGWLVSEMLKPTRDRILPQIAEAQRDGEMIRGNPSLVYHMLISMATGLASQQGEMASFGFELSNEAEVDGYWSLVQRAVFSQEERERHHQKTGKTTLSDSENERSRATSVSSETSQHIWLRRESDHKSMPPAKLASDVARSEAALPK